MPPSGGDCIAEWSKTILFRATLGSNPSEGKNYVINNQCDQIWRNFATLQNLQSLGRIFEGLFTIWQNFKPTLANFGHIVSDIDGQMMKNNLAIWSHCFFKITEGLNRAKVLVWWSSALYLYSDDKSSNPADIKIIFSGIL